MNQPIPFSRQYAKRLGNFVRMSKEAGSRSDYVQGGGGNTSCKVDDCLMAIKASGYRLDQIEADQAYAVLDYSSVRQFYASTEPAGLADIEAAGSARAKEATRNIEGLPVLRPSVEAGFHSLLDTYVLHTHAVYANLATCSAEGRDVAASALAGLAVGHVFVPYINPGAQLTFAVLQVVEEKKKETGAAPQLLFMQNHGFIVTGGDADECLALHDQVNIRLAAAYGVSAADWPAIEVKPLSGAGPVAEQAGAVLAVRHALAACPAHRAGLEPGLPDERSAVSGPAGVSWRESGCRGAGISRRDAPERSGRQQGPAKHLHPFPPNRGSVVPLRPQ